MAREARQKYLGTSSTWESKFRILEGDILTDQGRSPEVIALLQQTDVPSNQSDPTTIVHSKMLCARAYARLGRPHESERLLKEADFLSESSRSALLAEILLTKGVIAWHSDHLSSAESYFEKGLDIARQQGAKFLESRELLNLGAVALQAEHYDEALNRFHQASDLAESIHAQYVFEQALGNQGWAYYKLGDFEKSYSNFQQAEKQAKNLGSTHDRILWLNNSGLSLYQLGNIKEAEECYDKGMKAAEAAHDQEQIGDIYLALGFLALQQGKLATAKEHSEEALTSARALGNTSAEVEPLFLQALIAARQPRNNPEAQRLLSEAYQRTSSKPSLRWRVENAIANYYADTDKSRQAETWYQRSIQTFEAQRSTLNDEEQKLPFFANADVLYKDYAGYLIRSNREYDALQLLDLARARTLREGLGLVPAKSDAQRGMRVNPRAVAKKLDATIFFYSLGVNRSYLWSINANSIKLSQLPSQSEIEARISNYQKAILRSDDPLHQSNNDARYLYEELVAPAAHNIAANSRVILISDGALHLLNFETLVSRNSKGEHYWIEDVTLTNANSIRMLSASYRATPKANSRKLLLIGDPVTPAPEYASLTNASVEVNSIQKHFEPGSRTILTQASAVPSAYFASSPEQFSYIHFVAHATASRLSPLDSAVVLSAMPTHPQSYKLYARDILRLPLHAELVTISSCYGSGSRTYAGEGLVGLSWAFLRAGSHHVIAALWEADDASTSKLMDKLYGDLDSGEQPDAALRNAKLALLHSAGVYRKPYYWAAFQLQSGS